MGALETLLQTAQKIQEDHERVVKQLIEAQKEILRLKEDKYVDWDWVCWYLDVTEPTARLMLENEGVLAWGTKIKRFRRSDIIRFAERSQIKVRNIKIGAFPSKKRESREAA